MSRIRLIAALLIVLLAMICAGFLFTMIARSGFWLLLSFGLLGVVVFLQSFPWLALAAFVGLDVGVTFLLRRFLHGWFRSMTPVVCMLVALTLGGGFALSRTSLYASWQPPPPRHGSLSDRLLRGYGAWRFHNLFSGMVSEVRENGYVIAGPDGRTFIIDVTAGTEFPKGRDIAVGDWILVIGSAKRESIRAFGIRPFTPPIPPPKKNKL